MVFGIVRPAQAMPENRFYRNGIADEMLFVHEGTGVCRTVFGDLPYHPGDYLVPVGQQLAAEFGDKYVGAPESEWLVLFRTRAVASR